MKYPRDINDQQAYELLCELEEQAVLGNNIRGAMVLYDAAWYLDDTEHFTRVKEAK